MNQVNKIAVVMCTYSRLHLLPKTLRMLENQTDKDFDFYIWNNNQEVKNLDPIINQNEYSFQIKCHNSPQNIGGIGRFYQAQCISDDYSYVIFIDDDQQFDKYLIDTFRKEAQPNVITGWWAYKILGNYNQRTRSLPHQEADYVGTGGMVCPIEIFKNPKLCKDIPQKFLFIEDLWLSYFAKYECNYRLQRSDVNITFIPNEEIRNQHRKLANNKVEFHKYLKNKYNV